LKTLAVKKAFVKGEIQPIRKSTEPEEIIKDEVGKNN
jgi:hypothetical protein